MTPEKWIGGQIMHAEWDRNERCKFVVTELDAWFLTLEDSVEVPSLGEMLIAATELVLHDDTAVKEMDARLESGDVLLGYVSEGVVEVHSPLAAPYPTIIRRIKGVFGAARVKVFGWTLDTGEVADGKKGG